MVNFSRKSVQRRPDLIFVAVLVVFAGCDSSSSEDSSSATDTATSGGVSLSKAEFIAKADALCEASKAKQAPLRKRVEAVARKAREEEEAGGGNVSDDTRRELAETLGQIVATAEAGLSKVQALGLPQADADRLDSIFQKTESAFESSLAYGAALEGHEDTTSTSAPR